jgi:hypothetical protein
MQQALVLHDPIYGHNFCFLTENPTDLRGHETRPCSKMVLGIQEKDKVFVFLLNGNILK